MEKPTSWASRPKPPTTPASRRYVAQVARYWDFLAVLLLMLLSLPAAWLWPRSLYFVRDTSLIDDNWHLDSIFKALRGIWIGRDVAFTHGPLFQWLSSLPSRGIGLSVGGAYATWDTVPLWCAVVFGYVTLRLLLPEQGACKRFLLLLLLCLYWSPSFRTSFAIVLFVLFLRGWYAVAEGNMRYYVLGGLAALLCGTAFLAASDTGVYATSGLLISLAGVALESRRDRGAGKRLLFALMAVAIFLIVFVLAINLATASLFDFRFWKVTFAMVSVYRWATAYRFAEGGTQHLLGVLVAGAAVFLLRAGIRPQGKLILTARTGFLLAGFVFALALLQTGLVRADRGHIDVAEFAMVLFAGAILFAIESPVRSVVAMVAVIACSVAFTDTGFRPSAARYNLVRLKNPLTACPGGYTEFDRACYPPAFSSMLQSAASYTGQHSEPQASLLVFPYQTMFGIATQRNVAGGLMQPYTASGERLSLLEISGLERAAAPVGLYLPDADLDGFTQRDLNHWRSLGLSLPVDGVANFTRTPEVWFWILRHYRLDQQLSEGVFALLKDGSRAEISTQTRPLGLPTRTFPIAERSSVINLGVPAWPGDADFLRLRLTVRYGFLWKLRKPERLQLEISRADGSHELQWFIVEPNVSSEIWFYPWRPSELIHYFEGDESHWRTGPRPAVTQLRLWVTPLDWVSQQPESVELESADAVRLSLAR